MLKILCCEGAFLASLSVQRSIRRPDIGDPLMYYLLAPGQPDNYCDKHYSLLIE